MPFTIDPNRLKNQLQDLLQDSEGRGSTDLYKAYDYSLDLIDGNGDNEYMRLVRQAVLVDGQMIFVTDGIHEAGGETELLPQSVSLMSQSQSRVITVGLGNEVDPEKLQELASHSSLAFTGETLESIRAPLAAARLTALERAKGYYRGIICTPVSRGNPSFEDSPKQYFQ